jgi:hypothetical protein
LETHQAIPRWAHSWATHSPVTGCALTRAAWLEVLGLEVPWPVCPASNALYPTSPSLRWVAWASLPHLPRYYTCPTAGAGARLRLPLVPLGLLRLSLVHRYLVCSLGSCPFFKLANPQERLRQRPACLVTRYALSGLLSSRQMALPSSQATPLSPCPAPRPRW